MKIKIIYLRVIMLFVVGTRRRGAAVTTDYETSKRDQNILHSHF
jgi:hypothetical protein